MANALYTKGKEALLDGSVSLSADTIKVVLVGSGYTVNLTTDEFLSDIPSGQIIATSGALSGKTETSGIFDASNAVLGAVSGSAVDFLVIYKDTGTSTTSRLLAYIDTATGLPLTPSGGSVTIAWDTGTSKIFQI
jgi:hypothetical protein